jgi:nicotinamide mononucleotide transporter PnuC
MEIFTLVTGVIYIILEIRQKNFMWVVGILTSVAAMWVFFRQGLYASFVLNAYYLVTSFIGLWQWGRDKVRLQQTEKAQDEGDVIHLNRLSFKTIFISLIVAVVGTSALAHVMELLENPMSFLDASVAVLSAVATPIILPVPIHAASDDESAASGEIPSVALCFPTFPKVERNISKGCLNWKKFVLTLKYKPVPINAQRVSGFQQRC